MFQAADRWAQFVVRGRARGRHDRSASTPAGGDVAVVVSPAMTESTLKASLDVPWLMRPNRARGIVGAPSWPLFVLALVMPVGALTFLVWTGVVDEWADTSSPISTAVLLAVGGSLLFLLGTSGVRVAQRRVTVTGLLVVTSVPCERIAELRWDDGFTLVTDDGAEVSTMALGGSLLGAMAGNRRQRNVVVRLNRWLDHCRAVDSGNHGEVTIRWRWAALSWCLIWCGGTLATVLSAAFAR